MVKVCCLRLLSYANGSESCSLGVHSIGKDFVDHITSSEKVMKKVFGVRFNDLRSVDEDGFDLPVYVVSGVPLDILNDFVQTYIESQESDDE